MFKYFLKSACWKNYCFVPFPRISSKFCPFCLQIIVPDKNLQKKKTKRTVQPPPTCIMTHNHIFIISTMEHAVIEKVNPIALSEDQKAALNKYKIQARKDNEIFLRQHPEVSCLISDFLHEVRCNLEFSFFMLCFLCFL